MGPEIAAQMFTKSTIKFKPLNVYVMGPGIQGAKGDYWVALDEWPAYTNTSFYLTPTRTLSTTPSSTPETISYIYDPKNPVPTLGGNNLIIKCGPLDQRNVTSRSDVILFTSSPLQDYLAVTGHMTVQLYVSSNATDTDFTAKLMDIYPTGQAILLQDQAYRMRWRYNSTKVLPMSPYTVYPIEIDLWSISYIFNPSHKIQLAISSSNTPRFSTNPNNGRLIQEGGPLVFAQNTLHIGGNTPARLTLPVVSLTELEKATFEPVTRVPAMSPQLKKKYLFT
jgi:putative CocE/NonD family hydrolase